MPRRIRDLVCTVATLVVLFGLLTAFNPRVRGRLADLTGGTGQQWTEPGQAVGNVVVATGEMVSGYAADNTYLFFFLVVAVVMLILMLRT